MKSLHVSLVLFADIPKPDGDVRFIQDCSRLTGQTENDYCSSEWKQSFSGLMMSYVK